MSSNSFIICMVMFLMAMLFCISFAKEDTIHQPLRCEGCVAVIKELHNKLKESSGRKRLVINALDRLCEVNNFVVYPFSPPKMLKACNFILENYRDQLEESLISFYKKFKVSKSTSLQEDFCKTRTDNCKGMKLPPEDREPGPMGMTVQEANDELVKIETDGNVDLNDVKIESVLEKPPKHTTPKPKEEL